MSLPKKKRGQSKKARGGGASSKKPLIPKGHKYLGKAGNYHYTESATGTVYRGLGDSESSYRMEAMDKSVWKRPAGLTKKKAKAPKPKKRAPTKREMPSKSMNPQMAKGIAEEFKFQIDEALNSAAVGRIVKKARRSGLPKGHVQSIEAYAKSHRTGVKTPTKHEKAVIEKILKEHTERALDTRTPHQRITDHQKAQERKEAADEKKADGFKKKIDKAKTHDEIDSIVAKSKKAGLSGNMMLFIQNYAIGAGRDLYGTARYEKHRKKELAKREKERAVAQKRAAKEVARKQRQDKLVENYKKRLDAAKDGAAVFKIERAAVNHKRMDKSTLDKILVYANNAINNLESVHSKRNIEAAEQKATAVRVEKAEAFKEKIRDAVTKEQVDSVVGEALGFATYNPAFSRVHMNEIKFQAKRQNKAIARVDKVSHPITGKQKTIATERDNETGIESMKAAIRVFYPYLKDDVKDAKTLGELNKIVTEKGGDGYLSELNLTGDKGILLDSSKAAGVFTRYSKMVGVEPTDEHTRIYDLDTANVPILPFESNHVFIVDGDGKKIVRVGGAYLTEILKITKGQDIAWYAKKNRPLVGMNQNTGELIVLAPTVDRISPDEGEVSKEIREALGIPHNQSKLVKDTKAFYTRKYLFVTLPDGRPLRVSKGSARVLDNFGNAKANLIMSVDTIDKLPNSSMWLFAFEEVFSLQYQSREDLRGASRYLMPKKGKDASDNDFKVKDRNKQIVTKKALFVKREEKPIALSSLKAFEDKDAWTKKEKKKYKVKHGGKTFIYDRMELDMLKNLAGPNAKWYWGTPSKTGFAPLVAEIPDHTVQFAIAGRMIE